MKKRHLLPSFGSHVPKARSVNASLDFLDSFFFFFEIDYTLAFPARLMYSSILSKATDALFYSGLEGYRIKASYSYPGLASPAQLSFFRMPRWRQILYHRAESRGSILTTMYVDSHTTYYTELAVGILQEPSPKSNVLNSIFCLSFLIGVEWRDESHP